MLFRDISEESCCTDAYVAVIGIESRNDRIFVSVIRAFYYILLRLSGLHAYGKVFPELLERNYLDLLRKIILTGNLGEDIGHRIVGKRNRTVAVKYHDAFRYYVKDILELVTLVGKLIDGFGQLVRHVVKRFGEFSGFSDMILVGSDPQIAASVFFCYKVNFLQRLRDYLNEYDRRYHHCKCRRQSGQQKDIDIAVDKLVSFIDDGVLDSFDILTLISMLEEQFEIKIDGLDIVPENFQNVKAIIGLIEKSKKN